MKHASLLHHGLYACIACRFNRTAPCMPILADGISLIIGTAQLMQISACMLGTVQFNVSNARSWTASG